MTCRNPSLLRLFAGVEGSLPQILRRINDAVRRRLQDLRAKGANVALDDFGVEQSNLSRLLELNVDYIKLDRSLTQRLNQNAKANSIVQSTSQLCANLGIEIIAEGVETSMQSQLLLNYGISKQQGFLFRH